MILQCQHLGGGITRPEGQGVGKHRRYQGDVTAAHRVESQQCRGRCDHSRGTGDEHLLRAEMRGQAASQLDPGEDAYGTDGEYDTELGFAQPESFLQQQ